MPSQSDLFAPPTKEELKTAQGLRTSPVGADVDLFAPPTKQELSSVKQPDVSTPQGRIQAAANATPLSDPTRPPSQQMIQTGLNALPMAGTMVGGAVGTMAGGPVVGVGTAGAGGLLGEGLKNLGERVLLDRKQTREEYYKGLLQAGVNSMTAEMGGQIMGKAGESFAGSGVKDIAQSGGRPSTQQIIEAGKSLGVTPTRGMLTDDYVTRTTENSLSQSPSLAGGVVRGQQKPVQKAISKVVDTALEDASTQSPVEAGKQMRKGIADNLEAEYAPIQGSYDEIESKIKDVPINSKGTARIARNIRNLDDAKFAGSEGNKIANRFADWLESAENVNDIKVLKTKARQITQDPNASVEAKSVASSIMGKLEQAQTNTITRQAVQVAKGTAKVTPFRPAPEASEAFPFLKPSREALADEALSLKQGADDLKAAEVQGRAEGRNLIGKIKDTNKRYEGLLNDAKTFGEGSGLTKANKGMAATLEDIRSAKPEEMANALFDSGNSEYMEFVKNKFPNQFQAARQQRLAEIAHKAQAPNGAIDPKKLLKIVDNMTPEAKAHLFGAENVKRLGDAQTLLRAAPEMVGPSGTPKGFDIQEILNPFQNLRDAGRYGLMVTKPAVPAVGRGLVNYGAPLLKGTTTGLLAPKSKDKKKGLMAPREGMLMHAEGE